MAGSKSQGKRIAKLSTPLGDDVLVASRLDGSEGMSQLFEYRIEGLSSDPDIDLDALIGRNSTMSLETPDGSQRHFDGIVVEAEWSGQRYDDHVYRMVLRPWYWLLSRRTDCRIFHEKTAPQIIEEVMGAHSFAIFENRLTKSYPKLEYTVQYRESDLAFCCRMMEKHGIGYYFRHEPGQHTLVMSDSASSYENIPGGTRPFIPKAQREHVDGEHVYLMVPQRRFTSGKVAMTAYDFKKPTANMKTNAQSPGAYEHAELEVYDYPGKYVETDAGSGYSSAVMSAESARDKRRMVGGDLPSACPGQLMKVTGHPRGSENQEYLILSATHAFAAQGYRSGVNDEDAYHGTYELLPADADYAPPQVTEKARVYGPQTAVVVGDGEIDVDEYGRILVRFHWDRLQDKSRRVRIAQTSAQGQWGGIITPRIGQEVLVEFLEGDPDEPIVVGSVYHAKNMPPYGLPGHKTKSAWRSNTHQGKGYNEISYEDQEGQQNMFFHAQKDQSIKVLNNRVKRVEAHQVESIGQNKSSDVGQNHQEKIGGNKSVSIGGGSSGAALLGMLGNIVSAGGAFMQKHEGKVGSSGVSAFAGAVAGIGAAAETQALGANQAFNAAAGFFGEGGKAQQSTGAAIGSLLSKIMPGSGTLSTVIEKFRTDTIGMARTEQIGLYKNTVVGHTQTTSVGKMKKELIGEDYDVEAKTSIFTRTKKHTMMGKDKVVIGGPGGTIIIDQSGVTIKARHIWLKAPQIDLQGGAPDATTLSSDKPFAEDCSGK